MAGWHHWLDGRESEWWTRRPGVLQFMGSQRVGHDWATELNWILHSHLVLLGIFLKSWLNTSKQHWSRYMLTPPDNLAAEIKENRLLPRITLDSLAKLCCCFFLSWESNWFGGRGYFVLFWVVCFSLINSLKPILLAFIFRICDGSCVIKPLFFISSCPHSPGPVIPENQFFPLWWLGEGDWFRKGHVEVELHGIANVQPSFTCKSGNSIRLDQRGNHRLFTVWVWNEIPPRQWKFRSGLCGRTL